MKWSEAKKRIWDKKSPLEKVQSILWGIWFDIQDRWWIWTGTCPHEATMGKFGDDKAECLLCGKIVKV